MARPHARNNGNPPNTGLKARARERWVQGRRGALKPLIANIRATATKEDGNVQGETRGRVIGLLNKRVLQGNSPVEDILRVIIAEEKKKAETLTGNARQRTLDALEGIAGVLPKVKEKTEPKEEAKVAA